MTTPSQPPPDNSDNLYVEEREPPARPNPQRNRRLLYQLGRLPWWLLAIVAVFWTLYRQWEDDETYISVWESIRMGIDVTIYVTIRAYAIALVLGLLLAVMRMSRIAILYQASTFYVEVVRGVPTLILVYYIVLAATPEIVDQINIVGGWIYDIRILARFTFRTEDIEFFGAAPYFSELRGRDVDQRYRVIAALAISYSAFLSEVFRSGLQSIPRGQVEAAQSLGLSRVQTFRLVIFPQAFRIILPPLGNDFIAMLKESSLVSVVGIEDITRRGVTTAQTNFIFFEVYNVVALTYLALTLTLAMAVRLLEMYLAAGVRYSPANIIRKLGEWFSRVDPNTPEVPPSKG